MLLIAVVIAYARTLEGLTADPKRPECRAAYLAEIAPGETATRAANMAKMSGCELVLRGILREFIAHPLLDRPYVDQHSGRDLWTIAHEAGALRASLIPSTGDMVIIGGGVDGGGPEHAFMVLDARDGFDPYAHTTEDHEGMLDVTALDGGHRDAAGYESIIVRDHKIDRGFDTAPGSPRRKVRFVIDTDAILVRFGR